MQDEYFMRSDGARASAHIVDLGLDLRDHARVPHGMVQFELQLGNTLFRCTDLDPSVETWAVCAMKAMKPPVV
jgi:hypothetical protein